MEQELADNSSPMLPVNAEGWAILKYFVVINDVGFDYAPLMFYTKNHVEITSTQEIRVDNLGISQYLIKVPVDARFVAVGSAYLKTGCEIKLTELVYLGVVRTISQIIKRLTPPSSIVSPALYMELVAIIFRNKPSDWFERLGSVRPALKTISNYNEWLSRRKRSWLPINKSKASIDSLIRNGVLVRVDFPGVDEQASITRLQGSPVRIDSFEELNQQLSPPDGADWILLSSSEVEVSSDLAEFLFPHIGEDKVHYDMVYFDSDSCCPEGEYSNPCFKPDWDDVLLREFNYIGNCIVVSRRCFSRVGGFSGAGKNNPIYNFLLKLSDACPKIKVKHIAEIGFHKLENQLIPQENTIINTTSTPESSIANKLSARILGDEMEVFSPSVAIVIPTRDGLIYLEKAVSSIFAKTAYENFHIVIVDNNSSDQATLAYLDKLSSKSNISVLRYPHEFNFSAINNYAVDYIKRTLNSDLLLLLNDDVEIINSHWLDAMVCWFRDDSVGAVGAKLYYPDGRIQHAGVVVGIGGVAGHSYKFFQGDAPGPMRCLQTARQVSAVTGACLLTTLDLYLELGGLDEKYLKVAFNDIDYCLKVRGRDLKVIWTPEAECIHHESVSRGYDEHGAKRKRFLREVHTMRGRWGTHKNYDPFYNSNLSLHSHLYRLSRK